MKRKFESWFVLAAIVVLTLVAASAQGTGSTFTTIDFPGATLSFASRINPQGDIVGRYISAGVTHGFLLSK